MIRRPIHSPSGTKLWLLISQVDHARVSGELTQNWQEPFAADVIEAIAHHDDGWAAWEAEPKLSPDLGAPFSFLEMPVPVALVIWDHSIAAAAKFGPLASFLVAGHFYNLLSNSDHADDPLAAAWLASTRKLRTTWLDNWLRAAPANTLEEAKRAQHMLLLADLFSLWLCCDCPAADDEQSILQQSDMKLQTSVLFDRFQFAVTDFTVHEASGDSRFEGLSWSIAVNPYPFSTPRLPLSSPAVAVPARKFATWSELKNASWPVKLDWQLHS